MKVIEANSKERWQVVFREENKWQVGIYIPENTSLEEVAVLEKHNRPELFFLVKGEIVLVLSRDGSRIEEVKMLPGKIYVVDEWHNAYRPYGREGVALVVEAPDIQTEYIQLGSKCRE
ncbi:MAG: hypothetical protein GU357_03020 [Thermofilum sp.]|jgi:hypothetical protein|nr:hypothetical protein [Thermofilum sp.]